MVQDCRRCGRCCERWGWGQEGSAEDLVPWVAAGRKDILVHVNVQLSGGEWRRGDRLRSEEIPAVTRVRYWWDPGGRPLRTCPFLRMDSDGLASCAIHPVRPAVCREYSPWKCTGSEYLLVKCPACREMMP